MQQLLVWQQGKLQVDCSFDRVHEALQDKNATVWLDIQFEQDLTKYRELLLEELELSPLTVETIEEGKERARLVNYRRYFYLVTHGITFEREEMEATTPKLDIVFGMNFLITIHRAHMPWLQDILADAQTEADEHIMSQGTAVLLHSVLDTLVDSYFPVMDVLDEIVDGLENDTVEKGTNEVQGQIFRMKRVFAQLRRVISPQIEVSNALITRTGDFIPTEVEPYFADVHDHLVRTFEILDSYRDLMSSLLDVYLTTVANRQNDIMKQLALISTIFLPITFITGVFGQNFGKAPQVDYDNGLNFWLALALMATITVFQLWYFRYRKWI